MGGLVYLFWGGEGDFQELGHYPLFWWGGASQVALVVKNPPATARDVRDTGSISESGRLPGEEHGNPLGYSFLENPMERGAHGLQSVGLQRVRHDWSDVEPTFWSLLSWCLWLSLACWCVTMSIHWVSQSSQSWLVCHLDPFDSNQFMLMSLGYVIPPRLYPDPFSPVFTFAQHKSMCPMHSEAKYTETKV